MSFLLLDTNALIFLVNNSPRLTDAARARILDDGLEVCVSAVSFVEIGIKVKTGKLDMKTRPAKLEDRLRSAGLTVLALEAGVALGLATLPMIHNDPFDRLLVLQAAELDAVLLTSDGVLSQYSAHARVEVF